MCIGFGVLQILLICFFSDNNIVLVLNPLKQSPPKRFRQRNGMKFRIAFSKQLFFFRQSN